MERILNRPLVNTFGWLGVNGTAADVPEEIKEEKYVIESGSERTVILNEAAHISAEIEENAVFKLVQIRRPEEGAKTVNDISVKCGDGARFEWYRVIFGGGATYDNCSVALDGKGSSFKAAVGYRLCGEEIYDVNCEAIHTGQKTVSDIFASGVLSDKAFKLLRGTIDLRRGCAGAVGKELEDVLLVDETVRCQTVPVILCSEEDVEGDHGATIGRPDEQLIYYMESRGLDRETILEQLSRAKLDAVIRRIPDEKTVQALLEEE